eukprot:scaffold54450_cov63-Phaeocystis_antarctica.AAC.2
MQGLAALTHVMARVQTGLKNTQRGIETIKTGAKALRWSSSLGAAFGSPSPPLSSTRSFSHSPSPPCHPPPSLP